MASNFVSVTESLHFIRNFNLLYFTSIACNAWYGSKSCIFNCFFPWITLISEFKLTIFAVSGSLISLALFFQWRTKYLPCPADPKKAKLCQNLRKISWILLYISLVFYSVGFFFSFIAIKIFY